MNIIVLTVAHTGEGTPNEFWCWVQTPPEFPRFVYMIGKSESLALFLLADLQHVSRHALEERYLKLFRIHWKYSELVG